MRRKRPSPHHMRGKSPSALSTTPQLSTGRGIAARQALEPVARSRNEKRIMGRRPRPPDGEQRPWRHPGDAPSRNGGFLDHDVSEMRARRSMDETSAGDRPPLQRTTHSRTADRSRDALRRRDCPDHRQCGLSGLRPTRFTRYRRRGPSPRSARTEAPQLRFCGSRANSADATAGDPRWTAARGSHPCDPRPLSQTDRGPARQSLGERSGSTQVQLFRAVVSRVGSR